tara:strand:+ start:105 stop:650 length:546 start_codon:yes stop_codon:yes gene_type:complete
MTGKGKKKDDGLERSATLAKRSQTLAKKGKAPAEAAPAAAPAAAQKTVFISCSQLIKEVKLCVGPEHQEGLNTLYEKLTSQQVPAEEAVKLLMAMVGSTIVQQAGLSVMNTQKGTLPHGWLEYSDEASGRPYYYNVHTKVTTWYKPQGSATPAPPPRKESNDMMSVEFALDTHEVAMTGFL